jgi:hypothetical protein
MREREREREIGNFDGDDEREEIFLDRAKASHL